jgi:uncharacterized metal-binding protein YceD (DUF177 family)
VVSAPEFSRPVRVDTLGSEPRGQRIEADEGERAALAKRFDLPGIARLAAEALLARDGLDVTVEGRIEAEVTQSCVATGIPVGARIEAPFRLVFRPPPEEGRPDEEMELTRSELDVVFYEGDAVDLGEAAAETLALALDPYPRTPNAEEALKAAGVKTEAEAGPFGALVGLKDKLKK